MSDSSGAHLSALVALAGQEPAYSAIGNDGYNAGASHNLLQRADGIKRREIPRKAPIRDCTSHATCEVLELTVPNVVQPPTVHRQHLRCNPT
jgi:hypothetical protein